MRRECADCRRRPSAAPAATPLLRGRRGRSSGAANTPSPTGAAPLPRSLEKYFAGRTWTGTTRPAVVVAPPTPAPCRLASQSLAAASNDTLRELPATPVALYACRNSPGASHHAAAGKLPSGTPAFSRNRIVPTHRALRSLRCGDTRQNYGSRSAPCRTTSPCTRVASAPARVAACGRAPGPHCLESFRCSRSWSLSPCRFIRFFLNSFPVELHRCPAAVNFQRAVRSDSIRPDENPVLPRGKPSEYARLHRFRAAESQICFKARQRVRRKCHARLQRLAQFVVPVQIVRRCRHQPGVHRFASGQFLSDQFLQARDLRLVAAEPRCEPRKMIHHR